MFVLGGKKNKEVRHGRSFHVTSREPLGISESLLKVVMAEVHTRRKPFMKDGEREDDFMRK